MYYDMNMMSCFGVERLSDVGVGTWMLNQRTFFPKDQKWYQGISSILYCASSRYPKYIKFL
jgi:hypothetical protein